jgi:hypothetical protein
MRPRSAAGARRCLARRAAARTVDSDPSDSGPRSCPGPSPAAPAGHGRTRVREPARQIPKQVRRPECHRFRRLRNRNGRRGCSSPAGATRSQAVGNGKPWARRIDRRDQFVSAHVRALGCVLMVPDVTIPRLFAGTRLGYPLPDGVWCGWHQGKLGDDRVLPGEVLAVSPDRCGRPWSPTFCYRVSDLR